MPATKRNLDFTNVKEGGGISPRRMPMGDYRAVIKDVADHKTDKDPNQWVFTIQLTDHRSSSYGYYCGTTENMLWKVRNLFLACGIQVPKKRMGVDPNKLVGKIIGITLEDDEYDGKLKSSIAGVFPADELEQDETDDEPDDEIEEDDLEEEEDEEEEPPPPARKTRATAAKKAPAKATARRKPAPVEDDEDDEDLEIDDL